MQDFCKSDIVRLFLWITAIVAVYLGVYGPFVALLRWLFVRVLLVAYCFALCALVVCASDRIATRQAVGVYRAGIDQGGVTPLRTAQNKKGGSDPTSPYPM